MSESPTCPECAKVGQQVTVMVFRDAKNGSIIWKCAICAWMKTIAAYSRDDER